MSRQDQIIEAVQAFINASTWRESKRFVEEQRAILLTDEADALFEVLLSQFRDHEEAVRVIKAHRDLLARCRREGIDAAFAELVPSPLDLNALIREINRLTRVQELPRRIQACQEALRLTDRTTQQEIWAALQVELADSLAQNPLGKQADNLEEAIRCYEQALEVYTRQATPEKWARGQSNLANAYLYRIRGTRADNLEKAIHHGKLAEKVYSRQAFPQEWAVIQNNLGNAYLERIQGTRAENVEQAIDHYKQALQVRTRQTYPLLWASTQNNLGAAYRERILGARAANLEQAIYHYQQALQVRTDLESANGTHSIEWAQLNNNLLLVYLDRMVGARTHNLEQAIYHGQQALQVRTRQAFPQEWAETHNNLGLVYSERMIEGRTKNRKQAISHFRLALDVYTPQAFPQKWAQTMSNLGEAYRKDIRQAWAENLEQAIECYKQALKVYTLQTFPREWAAVQNNLGEAYRERIRGERAANLEQAIYHYQQALRTNEAPQAWAQSMNNLANAYRERIRGTRADNLKQAIDCYKQALQVRTRQAYPGHWAQTMSNLATAYYHANNLEQAIDCYQQALDLYTRRTFAWAGIQNNLANAYRKRTVGEQAENLEQAIHHLKLALRFYTRQTFPQDWAMTQHNLASTYRERYRSYKGNAEHVKLAYHSYRQALEIHTPQAFPLNCRATAYWFGHLLYDERDFAESQSILEMADQAVEALWHQAERSGAKERLAAENADLYARLIASCLHSKNEEAAFEYATAGKGRAFVDTLANDGFNRLTTIDFPPNQVGDPKLNHYQKVTQEIDNIRLMLIADTLSAHDRQTLNSELQTRIKEQATLWEDLTFKHPNLTATLAAARLTASDARQLAADLHATLVEYVHHAAGWSAFVISKESVTHVPLKKVNDKFLNDLPKWIKNLESKRPVFRRPKITRKRLTQLYAALIAPLQEHLPPASQAERLVIAPFGALHQLPLNAAQNPDTLAYLSQECTLTFTPSLAALRVSLDGARQANWSFQPPEKPIHIAHAGHPEMTSLDPLQKADQSAAEMADIFPNLKQLSEENATLQAAVTDVANRDLIHFYCHGIFEPDNPNQSGLLLDDGFLTVQRIITDLDLTHTHLTTLAACRTGRVGVTQGEELVGLIQALLIAGSKSVVATLWKVDETPTQTFFQHFYHALHTGHLPAEALTLATQAIRQTKGWEHPYYWAAFQISGLAFDMPK